MELSLLTTFRKQMKVIIYVRLSMALVLDCLLSFSSVYKVCTPEKFVMKPRLARLLSSGKDQFTNLMI
jgi:hypothetical protein